MEIVERIRLRHIAQDRPRWILPKIDYKIAVDEEDKARLDNYRAKCQSELKRRIASLESRLKDSLQILDPTDRDYVSHTSHIPRQLDVLAATSYVPVPSAYRYIDESYLAVFETPF